MKHLYLIGIGGVGMAWIADYALAQGWRVSGSDAAPSHLTERLEKAGASIHYGCDPAAIPKDVSEAVITSAITPTAPSFPELEELKRRKLPISKRAVWIGKLTKQKFTITVSGAHGKTTTTAMIGWILEKAGLEPTVFVGGSLAAWQNRTRIGQSKYLVLEADEFDRSFHQFYPQIAVLLNIDADHLDYYKGGIQEIERAFHRFLRNLPVDKGMVIGYGRDSRIRRACRGFSYRFRWYDETHLWPGLKLPLPGKHLLLNATAAAKVAHELLVPAATIKEALATFPGVGRRFELLGKWGRALVYDDYAHHPQEVAATLQAAREKYPRERLTVIFQPHQKERTFYLLKEFGRCFDQNPPDRLILAPIYEVAGRETGLKISSQTLAEEIKKSLPKGMELLLATTSQETAELAKESSTDSDIILSMGAGSLRSWMEEWLSE